jgi:prepilin-type N-terminal cleavage/methylation domain-containing protein
MTNFKKTAQQGFTLIELLVVIAIIGILAGILFVAINPKKQTDKATDSAIASTMGQIPLQATVIDVSNYSAVCDGGTGTTIPGTSSNTTMNKLLTAIKEAAVNIKCGSNVDSFAVAVTGKTDKFCVDVSGLHKNKDKTYTIGGTGTAGYTCTKES